MCVVKTQIAQDPTEKDVANLLERLDGMFSKRNVGDIVSIWTDIMLLKLWIEVARHCSLVLEEFQMVILIPDVPVDPVVVLENVHKVLYVTA